MVCYYLDVIPSLDAYGTQFDMGLCQTQRPVQLAINTPIVDSSGKLTFEMQSPNQNLKFNSNTTLNDLKAHVKEDLLDYVAKYGSSLEYNLNHTYPIPMPSGEYDKSVLFTSDTGEFKMTFDYPQDFTGWLTDQMFIQTPTTPDPDPVTGKFKYKVTFDETGFGTALEQRAEELADKIVKSFSDSRYTIETSGEIKADITAAPTETTQNVRYSSLITTQYRGLKIQTSSNEGDHITIPLTGMDTEILGIDDIKVSNYDEASASIKKIHHAVNIVSGIRSDFGAIHNRMSAAMMVDDVLAENTQAAESQIRDTDMSSQSVEQSKYRILGQMKEAVLAQANHTKDGVAVLLQ
jgi:flagellin-like hook-associated protein FlgL